MDLGASPVSWTVVPRFNRVGSYIPENSTVPLLGGLLTLDLFDTVIEKLPLSLHDYYGVRQRNRDLQASGIPPPASEVESPFDQIWSYKYFVDLGPSPVSWTVVPQFFQVGSYSPENSTVFD